MRFRKILILMMVFALLVLTGSVNAADVKSSPKLVWSEYVDYGRN